MLCSNDVAMLKQSVESFFPLIATNKFEIIVVDNLSNDGSTELLKEYESLNKLVVIVKRCSRGLGRQIAFERARGIYILSHMDCDDIFSSEGIMNLLRIYHRQYEGLMLMTKKFDNVQPSSGITIAPSKFISEIGGWRDINWGEDWDLWSRAARQRKYVVFPYPTEQSPHTYITVRHNRMNNRINKIMYRYAKYRDSYRIGRKVFLQNEKISLNQQLTLLLAKFIVHIKRNKLHYQIDPNFDEMISVYDFVPD